MGACIEGADHWGEGADHWGEGADHWGDAVGAHTTGAHGASQGCGAHFGLWQNRLCFRNNPPWQHDLGGGHGGGGGGHSTTATHGSQIGGAQAAFLWWQARASLAITSA